MLAICSLHAEAGIFAGSLSAGNDSPVAMRRLFLVREVRLLRDLARTRPLGAVLWLSLTTRPGQPGQDQDRICPAQRRQTLAIAYSQWEHNVTPGATPLFASNALCNLFTTDKQPEIMEVGLLASGMTWCTASSSAL